ncbi:Transmembrane secretion effector [Nonomuraea maritima]|uniref:Transmembrane secretion effector n=1 Tax=Nonomuraea maritima TaxID=683260 RepID=A0A1G9S061_9ACTN|nr:MFS transporter [Nonomuraea maritima]SDM28889.1 Transmembrane secretion effector [Nonomuraea maritima]
MPESEVTTSPEATLKEEISTLFRQRNFRRYYASISISAAGSSMAPVALAFGVLEHSGSPAALGTVLTAQVLPNVVLLLIGGVVGDRWSRSRIMASANLVSGTAQVAIALTMAFNVGGVPLVAALATVYGAANAFYSPAAGGILPQLVGKSHLARANALVRLTTSSIRAIGPVVAGILVAAAGASTLLIWDGLSFFIACALLFRLTISLPPKVRISPIASMIEGWGLFVSRRWLAACTLVMTVGGMAWLAGFQLLGPVTAAARGGSTFWGAVVSCYAIGLVSGGLVMLAWRPHRPLVAANLSSSLLCFPLLGLGLSWPNSAVLVSAVLAGIGTEISMIAWATVKQEKIPVEELSRITAFDQVGAIALAPLAYPVAGFLAAHFGSAAVIMVCVLLIGFPSIAVLALRSVRRVRSEART